MTVVNPQQNMGYSWTKRKEIVKKKIMWQLFASQMTIRHNHTFSSQGFLPPLRLNNRPFAGSGHMVRNKLHWDTNNVVGLPKQRNSYQSSPTILCFESPTTSFASQCNLFRTMWLDPVKGLLHVIHAGLTALYSLNAQVKYFSVNCFFNANWSNSCH